MVHTHFPASVAELTGPPICGELPGLDDINAKLANIGGKHSTWVRALDAQLTRAAAENPGWIRPIGGVA